VFGSNRGGYSFDEADQRLAKTMSNYWVRFAATGDPNQGGLPEWPKVVGGSAKYMDFGAEIKVGNQVVSQQAYDVLEQNKGSNRAGRQ